jgi:HD-GYP domain-containing protein (c-di-GMP phosphodiesterase class II)
MKKHECPDNSKVNLIDLISCLSDAMDYIDPAIVNHHKHVAYVALCLAEEMGMSLQGIHNLVLAGALHDIGAFSLRERKEALSFEIGRPTVHAQRGYSLLRLFGPTLAIATIVRFHHIPWNYGRGSCVKDEQVPMESHIIHLADRISVLVNRKREILAQIPQICKTISGNSGRRFVPGVVDAFLEVAARESFWLDLTSPSLHQILSRKLQSRSITLDYGDLLGFSMLFSRIIDFKSPFTATHSRGVASSARILADSLGFSKRDCDCMEIAGYLHDLGKLAVPVEILDKPAKLSRGEFNVVRHHTFYTYRILETMESLQVINHWAAFHHERLDGSGYPFHLKSKDLPLGSQIMAVADVFSALAEDRPYRTGMKKREVLDELEEMVTRSALNGDILSVLKANYGGIDAARAQAQADARREYLTL